MTCMNFTLGDSKEILQEKSKFRVDKKSRKDSRKFESSPKYCAGVLVGNWFDRRTEYTSPFNEWQTTYKSLYKSFDPKFLNNDRSAAWDRKLDNESLGARFIIGHYDEKYLKNMTTTEDIFFRILPQKVLCQRTFKSRRNEWVPQQDLLQSFGNATEDGFIKYKQLKLMMELEEFGRPWDTTYQFSFSKPLDSSNVFEKRHVKPRSDFNEINLDHLGIDLSKRCPCPIPRQLKAKLPYEP